MSYPAPSRRTARYRRHTPVRARPGFTLVELLVVIAIIGILSSLSVVTLDTARKRARDAQRRADLRQVYTALQLYYDGQPLQQYPDMSSPTWWADLSPYLLTRPVDPRTRQPYAAASNQSALQQFCLYAALEADSGVIVSTERGMFVRSTEPENGLLQNCYSESP